MFYSLHMLEEFILQMVSPTELVFVVNLVLCSFAGLVIGIERESRGKDAGISTHMLVIMGSMLFTFLSMHVDPLSTSRIASQVVVGIGFLGAGLILKDGTSVRNLTTAASLWFAAAIGMAFGYGYYVVAIASTIVCVFMPRIPHITDKTSGNKIDE